MSELTMRPTRLETSPVYAHLDDWEVLEDGEPIGRIYESREKRPGLEWYCTSRWLLAMRSSAWRFGKCVHDAEKIRSTASTDFFNRIGH
jgi:hypothetical protein